MKNKKNKIMMPSVKKSIVSGNMLAKAVVTAILCTVVSGAVIFGNIFSEQDKMSEYTIYSLLCDKYVGNVAIIKSMLDENTTNYWNEVISNAYVEYETASTLNTKKCAINTLYGNFNNFKWQMENIKSAIGEYLKNNKDETLSEDALKSVLNKIIEVEAYILEKFIISIKELLDKFVDDSINEKNKEITTYKESLDNTTQEICQLTNKISELVNVIEELKKKSLDEKKSSNKLPSYYKCKSIYYGYCGNSTCSYCHGCNLTSLKSEYYLTYNMFIQNLTKICEFTREFTEQLNKEDAYMFSSVENERHELQHYATELLDFAKRLNNFKDIYYSYHQH